MDPLEAAARAGFIPDGKRETFIAWLVKSTRHHALLPHPDEERLQGDLLHAFPFVLVIDAETARIKPQLGLILNNACDLQPKRSEFCNVALAADYSAYSASVEANKASESAKSFLADVSNNRVDDLFFLRDCPGYPNGVIVFLNRISTLPSSIYENALAEGQRFASLSQQGFYHLLIKLTRFLARAESNDVNRQLA